MIKSKFWHILLALITLVPNLTYAQAEEAPVEGITFGNWEKLCRPGVEAREACRLIQLNKNAASGNVIMRTEIAIAENGNLVFLATVPLGLDLSDGPWLSVDGVYIAELKYDRCSVNGCNAVGVFGRFETSFFLNGENAVITIQPQEGVRVGISISLGGFLEGYESVINAGISGE
jgi:invasion protein IalB